MQAYDPNNIFAKILRGELPCYKVYEDDKAFAFLDIMPRAPGHTLVLPKAAAIVSCRIVPDMDPKQVERQLTEFLTTDPPWGAKVTVKPHGAVAWWMTDPNGPAFEAALAALRNGFDRDPIAIGCGGSIGFVGPLADLFGGAPALLLGIEDPQSNAHAPNESLHEGDFQKLMASLANLFENVGKIPPGRIKS